MAALPTTTTAFASGATEAQFKSFLTGQRDYLAGLFGTDGTTATAKTTLGVVAGVSSVNGNAGSISAAQISAAATAGYGYTPANPANAATDHNHAGAYTSTNSYGAVGEVSILQYPNYQGGISIVNPGDTVPGSYLVRAVLTPTGHTGNTTYWLSGSWRSLSGTFSFGGFGLFQRVA